MQRHCTMLFTTTKNLQQLLRSNQVTQRFHFSQCNRGIIITSNNHHHSLPSTIPIHSNSRLLLQQQQVRCYMITGSELNTRPEPTPFYPSTDANRSQFINTKNYTVLYCNPYPKFVRVTCMASLIYALLLAFAAYQLAMSSIEKSSQSAEDEEETTMVGSTDTKEEGEEQKKRVVWVQFDAKMKMAASLLAISLVIVIGFSFYAKKNVLEFGVIRNGKGQLTEARVVFGEMLSLRGTREKFYPVKEVTSPSLHMLKLNDVEKITDPSLMRKRKSFGDYMFLNIGQNKHNYLMDLTSQKSFVNKAAMAQFFIESAPKTSTSSKHVQF